MADYVLNEGSTAILGLWFKDENEKNVTPSSVVWRLDDVSTMSVDDVTAGQIIDDTTESVVSYKHTLYIPGTANVIINRDNLFEEKLVSVKYYYGDTGVGTEEFRYRVRRLDKPIS